MDSGERHSNKTLAGKAEMSVKTRISELALGYAVNEAICYAFDFGLYPLVIFWLGLWRGGAVMSFLSFIVCWLSMKFYDWSKRDWLGIEAIKSLKDYTGPHRSGRLLSWVLRKSDPVACILLSLKLDPFVVTVYLRRGRFGGMTARDWRYFLLSWFVANASWALLCFAGVETIAELWKWFMGTQL
jgi:hypothetical protein